LKLAGEAADMLAAWGIPSCSAVDTSSATAAFSKAGPFNINLSTCASLTPFEGAVSELAPLKVHAVSLPEGLPRKLHQIGQEPQQQTVSYQNVEFCSSWGTNTAPASAVAVCAAGTLMMRLHSRPVANTLLLGSEAGICSHM